MVMLARTRDRSLWAGGRSSVRRMCSVAVAMFIRQSSSVLSTGLMSAMVSCERITMSFR